MVITSNMKANETKIKKLSPKEYLDMIKPYLSDIINDHKTPKKLRFLQVMK